MDGMRTGIRQSGHGNGQDYALVMDWTPTWSGRGQAMHDLSQATWCMVCDRQNTLQDAYLYSLDLYLAPTLDSLAPKTPGPPKAIQPIHFEHTVLHNKKITLLVLRLSPFSNQHGLNRLLRNENCCP